MPARATGRPRAALLATALLAATAAVAQVPKPPPARPPAAAPDPAFEAMRAAFEALPEAERKALQDALVWTGAYNSVVTGAFGRRTFEALNAAARADAGDPLDPKNRAALLAAGAAARKAVRFTVKADPASGIVIGLPEGLLPKRSAVPGGTRWQSADGRLTVESRSFPPGETDLDALFARATAPSPDRKVTYKLKRPDFVVVTGETGAGRSYVRYAAGPDGIRGFTIGYEAARAADLDRLVIAIANSFVPFPDAPAEAPPAAASMPAPPAAAASPIVGTGLVVAPGRVLTASALTEGCPAPRIGGAPARILRSEGGLALLEAAGLPSPRVPGFHGTPASEDRVVVTVDGEGVFVAPGTASDAGWVTAPLQPGAAGAPVLDRAGGLAGLVARYPAAPRLVAGVAPPARFAVVPGAEIAAFLAGNGLVAKPPPAGGSLGAAASAVGEAVVGIACGR